MFSFKIHGQQLPLSDLLTVFSRTSDPHLLQITANTLGERTLPNLRGGIRRALVRTVRGALSTLFGEGREAREAHARDELSEPNTAYALLQLIRYGTQPHEEALRHLLRPPFRRYITEKNWLTIFWKCPRKQFPQLEFDIACREFALQAEREDLETLFSHPSDAALLVSGCVLAGQSRVQADSALLARMVEKGIRMDDSARLLLQGEACAREHLSLIVKHVTNPSILHLAAPRLLQHAEVTPDDCVSLISVPVLPDDALRAEALEKLLSLHPLQEHLADAMPESRRKYYEVKSHWVPSEEQQGQLREMLLQQAERDGRLQGRNVSFVLSGEGQAFPLPSPRSICITAFIGTPFTERVLRLLGPLSLEEHFLVADRFWARERREEAMTFLRKILPATLRFGRREGILRWFLGQMPEAALSFVDDMLKKLPADSINALSEDILKVLPPGDPRTTRVKEIIAPLRPPDPKTLLENR